MGRIAQWCFLITLLVGCKSASTPDPAGDLPAGYVRPFIGASTSTGKAGTYHGLGKTFPGATTPYGLVQVSPNTITGGDNGSGYSYEHTTIEGFAFTQMSGIGWYGDLGNFLVMPTTGVLKTSRGKEGGPNTGYRSHYAKDREQASAGYYSTLLSDYNVRAEATAAPHSGMLRFTFPQHGQARIQIDLARRVGGTSVRQYIKVVDDHTIKGWMQCTPDGGGWGNGDGHANYTVYFYAQFSKPFQKFGVWSADIPDSWTRKREDVESDRYQQRVAEAAVLDSATEAEGKHLGFFSEFPSTANEQVMFRSGISFVSMEGAQKNLESEITDWDFDAVHQRAVDEWNVALSKVTVSGGSDDEKSIFYTALYHTMIDPRAFSDVDGSFTGGDGKVHQASGYNRRTIFSGWDVFRSQFPLQTIINPSLVNDMSNSLIALAHESNHDYLERWELLNAYSGCMIGNPAISVMADAYNKGILKVDDKALLDLAVKTSERFGNGDKGYFHQSLGISNTLEYAYTEWCTGVLASKMGKDSLAKVYLAKGQNYRNIFDDSVKWFRPRKEDGTWETWPKEGRLKEWLGSIESNPYQQGWFVPQDIPGMVALMGGDARVKDDLVQFFEQAPKDFLWNLYYNHANEPVHHVPFLFNYVHAPWLTQKWTREICARAYNNSVEGLVGNEDVGQMSAWYVLAASGLYQVCPGKSQYDITSPVFDKVSIALDPKYYPGKQFTIVSENNSPTNVYIQRATLNGADYNKTFIDFADIVKGGELRLVMGDKPNEHFGADTR
ncbi:GH92 family glycosyl hydrolase [Parachryseolinea silvisoli]|uniref:GH92 family glycosyl hydrolase n=1 Tax=Parachryseolinea silvisoli TaxID=2873601 RepID=UPI002265A63D|nr:GH92 family glycosyl hydrolase [Parachryseolinea silvisoli]MCD9014820.1 GH92 family glycosyl hydrolase [Parachryseolinea silvisoli]